MGNNHSLPSADDADDLHTGRFLEVVTEMAESDFRVEDGTEIPDWATRRRKWEEFVVHCYYLAANLRCQRFSRHAVTRYDPKTTEVYWDASPIRNVHEGVYAKVLLYAAQGVCLHKLLHIPTIRDELERHGMPGNVIWSIIVTGSRGEPICHLNDWLLDELDLRNHLAPGVPALRDRVQFCRGMIARVDQHLDIHYRNEGLSLPLLKSAVNGAACKMLPYATAQGYFLDLVDSPEVANLFYHHYRILSGGDYKSETEEDTQPFAKHCRISGVVAAVFCSMALSNGVSVEALAADPQFSVSEEEGSEDGSGWNLGVPVCQAIDNIGDTADE